MKLLVNGKPLVLGEKPKIRLTLQSPLFADDQPGSYTNQFLIPVCEQNNQILSWTHLARAKADRRKEYECVLECGTYRLVGTLQCRQTNQNQYKCNLVIPPGNVPAKYWKRKLKRFDFSTVTYPKLPVTIMLYSATVPDLGGSQFRTTVEVMAGTTVLFGQLYSGVTQSGTGDYLPSPFWADFASRMMEEVAKMPEDREKPWAYYQANGYKGQDLRGFDAEGSDTGFSMFVPKTGDYKIRITTTIDGRVSIRPVTITLSVTETVLPLQGDEKGNFLQRDERYCMPMMKNPDWYGENKSWNGYVNAVTQGIGTTLGGYTMNFENPTRFSISPAIYLRWAIEKTCDILGYKLNDQVFTDDDLKRVILWVNRSLDEQVPGTTRAYNQWQTSWKIADHLPDLTLKEWLNSFGRNLFFKPIFYPARKECLIVFVKDILAAPAAIDWTDKLSNTREIDTEDEKPQQLAYALDSSDGLAKSEDEKTKKEVPLFVSVPTDKEVDAAWELDYEKYELPFCPVRMETKVVAVNKTDPNSPFYSRNWQQETKEVGMTPTLKEQGVSPLFGQADTSLNAGRIMFYVPDRTIPNPVAPPRAGDEYPPHRITTADSETEKYSLQLTGDKGVLKTFAAGWIQLLSKPGTEKYRIMLDPVDLQQFRWEKKIYLAGLNYLVDTIDITLEDTGIFQAAEITVRRV
ncbi:hypothetical protein [Siphonobacter sp.]|uniref:hypothetical protein n=1 Tax=Siphonobacter sp. TaxID=1869184 RepID=UPI003B3BCFED